MAERAEFTTSTSRRSRRSTSRSSSCKTRFVRCAPRGREPARGLLRNREPLVRVGPYGRSSGMRRRRHRRVGARLGPDGRVARLPEAARARVKLLTTTFAESRTMRSTSPARSISATSASRPRGRCATTSSACTPRFECRRPILPRRVRRPRGVGSAEGEDQARRLHVRYGIRPSSSPSRAASSATSTSSSPDGSKIKRAFTYDWRHLDAARAARAPDRGGLLESPRLLGRR